MKKFMLTTLTLFSAAALAACGSQSSETSSSSSAIDQKSQEPQVVKVAAHVYPMVEMLELIQDDMAKDGYTLEIVKVSDNVQANIALHNKEVDANFFQHKAFMEIFNEANGAKLVQVQPVYISIPSYYAKNFDKIEDLPDGADIAIPSDPSNLSRALRLLAEHKIITLDKDGIHLTTDNIKDNPKNLIFTKIDLLNLSSAYEEKDMVFNYPTYISSLGLNPTDHGLIFEAEGDTTFAGSIVAREDNQDEASIQALKKHITSDEIRDFINKELPGKGKAAF